MLNLCTKVKSMNIRFLTLVEKIDSQSFKTLFPYFTTFQFDGYFL